MYLPDVFSRRSSIEEVKGANVLRIAKRESCRIYFESERVSSVQLSPDLVLSTSTFVHVASLLRSLVLQDPFTRG